MADISIMSIAEIERYLTLRKELEAFEGKAIETKVKPTKPAKAKANRKPMSKAAKETLSKAATARWKAAKKAGKTHL
jgi:hypothetical protein